MIIISDDITGAADCGVKFVEEGLSAEVILKTEYNTKAEFKIFCTESRGKSLKEAKQVVSEVKQYFGNKVYNTLIHRNVKLGESPSFGKPIVLYDASSTGSQNYMNLVSEILNQHG